VKKPIAVVFALAVLAVLGACGATPTDSAATPGRLQADEMMAPTEAPPQDTTAQRVPNMMGSGN
jgi:ABC-type glycerol-3-phosphate transport system substrate-binding protein